MKGKDLKLEEYKQRQRDWRDISVAQLSNANYLLITISMGLLAIVFNQKNESVHLGIDPTLSISWWLISVLLLFFSLFFGISVLLTRLYDFRISRHIALCRQRFYKAREDDEIEKRMLPYNNPGDINCFNKISVFCNVVFKKIDFISSEDIKKKEPPVERFNALRFKAKVLGRISLSWTKCQVLFLFLGTITYFIHVVLN